jgi:hypothetical protein
MNGRRQFIAQIAALPAAAVAATAAAGDLLYVLRDGNVERLRTDFNANRDKARLVFMLSPT